MTAYRKRATRPERVVGRATIAGAEVDLDTWAPIDGDATCGAVLPNPPPSRTVTDPTAAREGYSQARTSRGMPSGHVAAADCARRLHSMGRDSTFYDDQFGRPNGGGNASYTSDLVVVLMPFDPEIAPQYEAIRSACEGLGLRVRRGDDGVGSGFINRHVTQLIEDAEFLVCDLSRERPNVYYELGYAHGVGNEAEDILLVAREGTKLHFYGAPLRVHYYESPEHLKEIVATQLRAMSLSARSVSG